MAVCNCGCGQPLPPGLYKGSVRRFVRGHGSCRPAQERFWEKVRQDEASDCWLWTAARSSTGYGSFGMDRRTHNAHRVAYIWMVGEPPEGLHLDHLCDVRHCVNPYHLEPVPLAVNIKRGYARKRAAQHG